MNGPSDMYRDMFEPGWHEREKLHRDKFLDAIPVIGNPTSQAADGLEVAGYLINGVDFYLVKQLRHPGEPISAQNELVTLVSAQAAVAAAERNQRIVADSYRSRCDALEAALKQAGEPVGVVDALHRVWLFEGKHLPNGSKVYAAPVQPVEQPSNDFDIRGKLSTLKCWHRLTGEEAAELVALVAAVQPYDQQALELCNVCGWKALIPGDGCLNCELVQPVEQPKAESCTWHQIDDTHMPGTWDADCGAMWTFTDGGPVENDMRYCPKCGKPVAQEGGEV